MIKESFEKAVTGHLAFLDLTRKEKDLSAQEMRENIVRFAQDVIRPLDDVATKQDAFPHDFWKQLGDQGYKGILIPQEYGGAGLGLLDFCIATQEIARGSGPIAVSYVCDQALCSRQITTFGTEKQKQKYLPKLASGEFVGALAMSEDSAGSDVMSMKTHAKKVDGGYVINGEKIWITNGARIDPATGEMMTADVLVLYARTNKNPTKLTTFIVEVGSKGFNPSDVIEKSTTHGSDTSKLFFDDCFVPDENILGEVDGGSYVLMNGLNPERLAFSANTLGVAQAALEEAIDYTSNRFQHGKPINYNQYAAFQLADSYSEITMAIENMLTVAARADLDIRSLDNVTAASIFLRSALASSTATNRCWHYHGANGQTTAYRVSRQVGIAEMLRIGAGSEEMRLRRIAEDIIPGYTRHLKNEMDMRQAFADSLGMDPGEIDSVNIGKLIREDKISIGRQP